jgi:hypothetical protein
MIWIKIAAFYDLFFGVFHLFFWKLLKWNEQLQRVSSVNKAVFQTLNLCLTFMFFLIAYHYFFYTDEIQTTTIGHSLLLGMTVFWVLRFLLQVYLFDLKERVHRLLLIVFIAGVLVHSLTLF